MLILNFQDKPLVSVLIPTFNRLELLKKAIASVFSQSYENWELVIVDDGSQDSSSEYIFSLNDTRIRAFRFENNRGRIDALNLGLNNCKGDFIARLDSDDVFLPRHLELSLNFLLSHSETALVGSQMYLKEACIRKKTTDPVGQNIADQFLEANFVNNSTAVFKASIIKENSMRFSNSSCEDYDFWVRLSKYGNVTNLGGVAGMYLVHENQISNQVKDRLATDISKIKLRYAINNLFRDFNFMRTLKLFLTIGISVLRICKYRLGGTWK